MTATNDQVLNILRGLYRIIEAGERGYATAAINAKSRGLKLLFKSFAQQRASFKNEVLAEIRRLGGEDIPGGSITGMVHRGRVALFSAMIIEDDRRERVILKEVALGERYAAQTYQKALAADLPAEIRVIIQRQYNEVLQVIEQVHLLRGKDGKNMLVQLFDTEQDADAAVQSLRRAGFPSEGVVKAAVSESIARYRGKGTTIPETILSGVVGGIVWGSLIGVLAGFGVVQANPEWIGGGSTLAAWLVFALGITLVAALVGGVIGLVIGAGIADDDRYVYQQSAQNGRYLISALVDEAKTDEASQILRQAGAGSRDAIVYEGA